MADRCKQLMADFYIALAWAAFDRGQHDEYKRLMDMANAVWIDYPTMQPQEEKVQ